MAESGVATAAAARLFDAIGTTRLDEAHGGKLSGATASLHIAGLWPVIWEIQKTSPPGPGNRLFLGSKRPLLAPKPIGNAGGEAPHFFAGFWGGGAVWTPNIDGFRFRGVF
jgi:hypothetical protein